MSGLSLISINAQSDSPFSKPFSDGSRIFSQDYVITEFRSRPVNANGGIPEEKLFERQEWKLRNYELWLGRRDNLKPELFWLMEDNYEITQRMKSLSLFSFVLNDVYFSERESCVLYKTGIGLVVAKVGRKGESGWIKYPATMLERDFGFSPIFDARFKKESNLEIEAEYLSSKVSEVDDEGRVRRKIWTWKLKRNKWILISDKLAKKEN